MLQRVVVASIISEGKDLTLVTDSSYSFLRSSLFFSGSKKVLFVTFIGVLKSLIRSDSSRSDQSRQRYCRASDGFGYGYCETVVFEALGKGIPVFRKY